MPQPQAELEVCGSATHRDCFRLLICVTVANIRVVTVRRDTADVQLAVAFSERELSSTATISQASKMEVARSSCCHIALLLAVVPRISQSPQALDVGACRLRLRHLERRCGADKLDAFAFQQLSDTLCQRVRIQVAPRARDNPPPRHCVAVGAPMEVQQLHIPSRVEHVVQSCFVVSAGLVQFCQQAVVTSRLAKVKFEGAARPDAGMARAILGGRCKGGR